MQGSGSDSGASQLVREVSGRELVATGVSDGIGDDPGHRSRGEPGG